MNAPHHTASIHLRYPNHNIGGTGHVMLPSCSFTPLKHQKCPNGALLVTRYETT
jgi:hypothetical protein